MNFQSRHHDENLFKLVTNKRLNVGVLGSIHSFGRTSEKSTKVDYLVLSQ